LGYIFEVNREFGDVKSPLVDTDSKTSNRLKIYLSRFWDFYQTSPTLQKVLENA